VVFLWLLSFAHAKESDSPVGETYSARAAETAGPQAQENTQNKNNARMGEKNVFATPSI